MDGDSEKNTVLGSFRSFEICISVLATVVSDSIHLAFVFYLEWLRSPLSDEWMADEELESSLLTGGSIAGGDRKSPTKRNTHKSLTQTYQTNQDDLKTNTHNSTSREKSRQNTTLQPIDEPHGCLNSLTLMMNRRNEAQTLDFLMKWRMTTLTSRSRRQRLAIML